MRPRKTAVVLAVSALIATGLFAAGGVAVHRFAPPFSANAHAAPAAAGGKSVALLVLRGETRVFVSVRTG